MATTKKLKVEYSSNLDSMARFINTFLANEKDPETIQGTYKGIADFCYGNSKTFTNIFLQKAGVDNFVEPAYKNSLPSQKLFKEFIQNLIDKKGTCIFLLKDTQLALDAYRAKSKKSYGMLVNRGFLCRQGDQNDYFTLVKLVYDSLTISKNIKDFEIEYRKNFNALIKRSQHFRGKAGQIAKYIECQDIKGNVTWVDMGLSFTFVLFCLNSVRAFSKKRVSQDYYCFSIYPWLQKIFKDKFFSVHNELVLENELKSIRTYQERINSRATAALLGFAIGDSLGFPAAGIEKSEVGKFIKLPIKGFVANKKHPYFWRLKKGQYTDNTTLLIISTKNIINNKGFEVYSYQKELANWGKTILKDKIEERWVGPTAIGAIKNLIAGKDYRTSGSTETKSCSSTYRVIPLGMFYLPFRRKDSAKLAEFARLSGGITHNSEISKTGAEIVALIVGELIVGQTPENAVLYALRSVKCSPDNTLLIKNIEDVVVMSQTKSDEFARRSFGTGSPIYQTLPLAIFFFLKYQNDFEKGILAAANSFREDTPEEKERIKNYSWKEQLIEAKGGNVDGIAGLTGCFLGAYLGCRKIPQIFLSVENINVLRNLGEKII